jgi:hypothetical protein
LTALGVYSALPKPTRDQEKLKAVAAEAQRLIAANTEGLSTQEAELPKEQWPSAIASLQPYSVTIRPHMVDIATKPFFDGGWGYGFAPDKQDLTMLVECWSELGHSVYWHGPC